jgi:hypothetical protein
MGHVKAHARGKGGGRGKVAKGGTAEKGSHCGQPGLAAVERQNKGAAAAAAGVLTGSAFWRRG